jgi:hypothetical protein
MNNAAWEALPNAYQAMIHVFFRNLRLSRQRD